MINLTERQRLALIAGIELLAEQMRTSEAGQTGPRPWSERLLNDLTKQLRSAGKIDPAIHTHVAATNRKRAYNVLGECGAHGMLCIACEVSWHAEDGPLGWCRECELIVAAAEEIAAAPQIKPRPRRTKPLR